MTTEKKDKNQIRAAIGGYAGGTILGHRKVLNLARKPIGKVLFSGKTQSAPALYKKLLRAADIRGEAPKLYVSYNPHYLHYAPEKLVHPKLEEVLKIKEMGLPASMKWSDAAKRHIAVRPFEDPFILAHEVSHASGGALERGLAAFNKPLWIKGFPLPLSLLGGTLGGMGLLTHAAIKGKKGEDKPWSLYAAPVVGALPALATQAEELRATLKARSLLKKVNMKVPGLLKRMVAQQGSYLIGTLGAAAPTLLGAVALNHYLNSKPRDERLIS